MAIEYHTDNIPAYIFNRNMTYENTVLSEHQNIMSGLRDKAVLEALLETQSRLFIGICLREESEPFIENNYQKYYNIELNKITNEPNREKREQMANVRAWTRLNNEAASVFLKKHKADGKAKIAVLDIETMDNRPIVEADLLNNEPFVNFTEGSEGI